MSIHQTIELNGSLETIFKLLTDSDQFSNFTGAPADIQPIAGETISCFDGMIKGMNIEVIPNQRLVQAWRVENWEEGVYSIVKFELEEPSPGKAKLVFTHTGYPEVHEEHLASGWHERYWKPMKDYLET